MATLREKELKKNVLDEVRYKHKGLALFMLTLFLWGPFVWLSLTLFWLTRHTDSQAPYVLPQSHIEKVCGQLNIHYPQDVPAHLMQ
ncbi:MAG: hypothetical protein LUI09_02675 [Prevotellaceae bacterium]|nr:hypothetical protein [Prevotellaceae bacterium]